MREAPRSSEVKSAWTCSMSVCDTHTYAEMRAHTNVLLIRLDGVFTPGADTYDSHTSFSKKNIKLSLYDVCYLMNALYIKYKYLILTVQ